MQTKNLEILSNSAMRQAEQLAINAGIKSETLMESAGKSVFAEIIKRYKKQKTLVLCGIGNNGGDGFVIARYLKNKGWPVTVAVYGDIKKIKNAALRNFKKLKNIKIEKISKTLIDKNQLVIDAVFGTGLDRNIPENLQEILKYINEKTVEVVAVDLPSGINGDSGKVMGAAVKAALTVTFARKKIGHVLLPGKNYSGEIMVRDIGVNQIILPQIFENKPELWLEEFPFLQPETHKYSRGHVVVAAGNLEKSGAGKLAAISALRAGAGLVTIASPKEAQLSYSLFSPAVMTVATETISEFKNFISDARKNTIVLGPGSGVGEKTRNFVQEALKLKKNIVLDADAITSYSENPDELFRQINNAAKNVVLTPHDGEFSRIFPELVKIENKIEKAKLAAKKSGAVVVLKGADTVIASPEGLVAVNTNGTSFLATAGTGDVLSGIIAGLLAQKMPVFFAAAAAVWIHSEAAKLHGAGLISSDLPDLLPLVINNLSRS